MIKILDSEQIRKCDQYTIENEPIRSIDLMERAARKCFEVIRRRIKKQQPVKVFCGPGNNGGDGLAIARMLGGTGQPTQVFILDIGSPSEDFRVNEKRLANVRNTNVYKLGKDDALPSIGKDDLVIDALFGSGLSRPLEGFPGRLVEHINDSGALVIAIDFPSGLFCEDNKGNDPRRIIRADHTLTFQVPKLAFLFPENDAFAGQWEVLDIGLHPQAIEAAETRYFILDAADIRSFYRPRGRFSHKGTYGHALLVAGSKGKTGAAVLGARAGLRSGPGLLTVYAPQCANHVIQTTVPEAMYLPDAHEEYVSGIPDIGPFAAIGAGPGLGTDPQTQNALKLLIQQSSRPLVLDADALNILAENPTWLAFLPKGTILTPHPGEFQRLVGKASDSFERLQMAREFAFRFQVVLVLKGAFSMIVSPDGRIWFNPSGNPGMATGGSGDVLTGMILGWLAQGYSPLESAMAGVFIHGVAGDIAASRKGFEGLIAGDIIQHIPKANKVVLGQ
jgi:ADP-dependent NAD(P)H-hydrate dehydratase / NAD(P)H-hydrate epimerase